MGFDDGAYREVLDGNGGTISCDNIIGIAGGNLPARDPLGSLVRGEGGGQSPLGSLEACSQDTIWLPPSSPRRLRSYQALLLFTSEVLCLRLFSSGVDKEAPLSPRWGARGSQLKKVQSRHGLIPRRVNSNSSPLTWSAAKMAGKVRMGYHKSWGSVGRPLDEGPASNFHNASNNGCDVGETLDVTFPSSPLFPPLPPFW